jgi:hypothetical protein
MMAIAMPAFAQMEITKQDYSIYLNKKVSNYSYSSISTEGISALADRAGSNQFYDLTTIEFSEQPDSEDTYDYFDATKGHPFAHVQGFNDADVFVRQQEEDFEYMYEFMQFKNDGIYMLGFGIYDANIGLAQEHIVFDEPVLIERVPRSFGVAWISILPFDFNMEDVEMVKKQQYVPVPKLRLQNTVDGWGTIKFPNGQTYPALRIYVVSTVEYMGMNIRSEYIRFETKQGHSAQIDINDEGVADYVEYTMATMDVITSDPGDVSDLPDGFVLDQNYPNPFNPSTTISYSIPTSADVALSVVDLTGRVVSRMEMPRQSAGTHSVQFDASNLSSGVYVYRLEAAGNVQSRKFTLIK